MRLHNFCAAIFYSTPPCVAKTAGAAGPIRAVRAANCYLSCAAASIGASLLYVLAASVITALAYIFLAFLLCTHGLQKFCARSTVRTWTILVVLACAPGVSAGDAESSKMPMFNGTKLGYAMCRTCTTKLILGSKRSLLSQMQISSPTLAMITPMTRRKGTTLS